MSGKVSASVRFSRVSKPLSPVTMRPLSCEATPLGLRRNARSFLSVQCGSANSHAPRDAIHRSMLVTLAWFSPIEPARARYRLAALEAVAATAQYDVHEEIRDQLLVRLRGGGLA